jgi:thiamine-phosphate pyrophosphorylase
VAGHTQQPLYIITDGGALRASGNLLSAISAALAGADGVIGYVQLREQHPQAAARSHTAPAADEEVIALARKLLPITERYGARLIINRRLDLAQRSGAHGVHLPFSSTSTALQESAMNSGLLVGCSAHSADEVEQAASQGFDYSLLAPIFPPLSKPPETTPLGLPTLAQAAPRTDNLLFALGGITADHLPQILTTGASGAAMISSLLLNPDPFTQARTLADICRKALKEQS